MKADNRYRPEKKFSVPEYICLGDDKKTCEWGLSEWLTVTQWRAAKLAAIEGEDKRTLSQFRAATLLLEQAEQAGIAEDVCLIQRLDALGAVTPHTIGGSRTDRSQSAPAKSVR